MRRKTRAVLQALAAEPGRALRGMDIYHRTGLLPGTTYPILLRLSRAGWIRSYWAPVDLGARQGPRHRYHQITADGLEAAATPPQGFGAAMLEVARRLIPCLLSRAASARRPDNPQP